MNARKKDIETTQAPGFWELFGFSRSYARQRYWGVKITAYCANIGLSILVGLMMAIHPACIVLAVIVGLACGWISFVTTLKRLRDANLSLYWSLLALVPGFNIVALIIFGCIGSSETKNTGRARGVFAVLIAIIAVIAVLVGMLAVVGYSSMHQKKLEAAQLQIQTLQVEHVGAAGVSATALPAPTQ